MRKFRLAGVLVGAAALAGLANSPALAATDVTVYGPSFKASCEHASAGHFASYGEVFTVYDECKDGWSAVVEVKASGDDYFIWNDNGADGSPMVKDRSYDEGTKVCIRAGSGEHSSGETGSSSWSSWKCGTA